MQLLGHCDPGHRYEKTMSKTYKDRIKIVIPNVPVKPRIGVMPTRREKDRKHEFVRNPKHKNRELESCLTK